MKEVNSLINTCIFKQYEDLLVVAGSDRSSVVAKIISEYFPPGNDNSNKRVLDLAAGTGVVGPHLSKLGFKNIDAVGNYQMYYFLKTK